MYKTLALLASSLFLTSASELETIEHGNLRERELPGRIFCLADPVMPCSLENGPMKGQFVCRSFNTFNVGKIQLTLCVPPLMILPGDGCSPCTGSSPMTMCDCPCGNWAGGGRLLNFQLPNGLDLKQCYPTDIANFIANNIVLTGRNPYSCVSNTPMNNLECTNPFPIGDGLQGGVSGYEPAPTLDDVLSGGFVPPTYDAGGNLVEAPPIQEIMDFSGITADKLKQLYQNGYEDGVTHAMEVTEQMLLNEAIVEAEVQEQDNNAV